MINTKGPASPQRPVKTGRIRWPKKPDFSLRNILLHEMSTSAVRAPSQLKISRLALSKEKKLFVMRATLAGCPLIYARLEKKLENIVLSLVDHSKKEPKTIASVIIWSRGKIIEETFHFQMDPFSLPSLKKRNSKYKLIIDFVCSDEKQSVRFESAFFDIKI